MDSKPENLEPRKSSIFDIMSDTLGLERVIQQIESEEMTDEQARDILYQALEQAEGKLEDKVQGYVIKAKELESISETRKAAGNGLLASAKVLENQVKNLKKTVAYALEVLGKKKVMTNLFTVTVATAGGKQSYDCQTPEGEQWNEVPPEFRRQEIEIGFVGPISKEIQEVIEQLEALAPGLVRITNSLDHDRIKDALNEIESARKELADLRGCDPSEVTDAALFEAVEPTPEQAWAQANAKFLPRSTYLKIS